MITKTIVFWAALIIWAPFKTTKLLSCLIPVWHCYIFPSWPLVTLSTNHVKTHMYIHCTQNAFCFFPANINIKHFVQKCSMLSCYLKNPNFIGELFENTWNLQFLITKTRYNIFQLVYWWNIKKIFSKKDSNLGIRLVSILMTSLRAHLSGRGTAENVKRDTPPFY